MAIDNSAITMKGAPIKVTGRVVKIGAPFPDAKLTGVDMSEVTLSSFRGKPLVVMSVPSLDTPVCSLETKRFNQEAVELSEKVTLVVVSRDLPFAQKRWCGAEGVSRVVPLSDHKHRTFGETFGVDWADAGLLARAVFVVDASGSVTHVEYVSEIADEPSYDSAIAALRKLL
jgi:thioredoxin-dependent peroxiredoxin